MRVPVAPLDSGLSRSTAEEIVTGVTAEAESNPVMGQSVSCPGVKNRKAEIHREPRVGTHQWKVEQG